MLAFQVDITCLTSAVESLMHQPVKIIQVCHQQLLSLEKALILREKQQLRVQYQIIAYESYQRDTKLSAAGFISINNALVLFIASTVCNNLVAICQFFSTL